MTERPYANATEQEIVLSTSARTPGQNALWVRVFGPVTNNVSPDVILKDEPLTDVDLASEAQDAVAGADMRVSLTYVQNRYGPFGYALARSREGDLCLYAWQRIQTPEARLSLFVRRAAISLRLRLCEPAASEATLLAPMLNLGIDPAIINRNWGPHDWPLRPYSVVGPSGASAVPAAALPAVAGPISTPPAARQLRRMRTAYRAAPAGAGAHPAASTRPFAADVVVPPPPDDAVPTSPAPPPPAAGTGTHS